MNQYTFYQQVKITNGNLELVQSNTAIINPTPVVSQYEFFERIKLDPNGKIIVKIKI